MPKEARIPNDEKRNAPFVGEAEEEEEEENEDEEEEEEERAVSFRRWRGD